MERIVFAEVLDRRGRVRQRVRLDSFPATIGRAYTNSVIIDDRHVCPEHVRVALDDDGSLYAEDLGSVNGMYLVSQKKRLQRVPLAPDVHIRIGHTMLRFRFADHSVPAAVSDKTGLTMQPLLFRNAYTTLIIFILSLAGLLFYMFLRSYAEFSPSKIFSSSFTLLLSFAAWSGVWSFVNRLVAHRFRFLAHLAFVAAVSVLFVVLETAFEYYTFLYSPGPSSSLIELAILTIVASLLLFGHLSMFATLSRLKRATASLLVAIGIFGSIAFLSFLDEAEFSSTISFPHQLKPLDKASLNTVPVDVFFSEVQLLQQDAGSEAPIDQ